MTAFRAGRSGGPRADGWSAHYDGEPMGTANTTHGPAGRRLLGLFAHPDDEVFCVGGTFALAAEAGAETMVVSFTKGEAGQIRSADIATRSTIGEVRAQELRGACTELGITHARCLDFVDGTLPATDRAHLVEEAVRIIREFRPDSVYSFDETGAYGHPDHIVMSHVAREACRAAGDPRAFPEAGTPHGPERLLQARFPQSDRLLLRLLVDWLSQLDTRFRGSHEFTTALLMFADGTSMLGYAADHLSTEWFPKGSFIIEQGEPASSLYLVLAGQVDVIVESEDGSQRRVATAGVGEFLGEIGIATNRARTAHCVAAENTTCFVLSPTARSYHAGRGAPTAVEPGGPPANTAGSVQTIDHDHSPPVGNLTIDLTCDVSAHVERKVRALARHASQYAISPGLFPDAMLSQLLGTEYFSCADPGPPADFGGSSTRRIAPSGPSTTTPGQEAP